VRLGVAVELETAAGLTEQHFLQSRDRLVIVQTCSSSILELD
jgi:hypothetical protein